MCNVLHMASAAGFSKTQGVAVATSLTLQEEGQPIVVPAMWLVPGALVGAAVLALLVMSGNKR